jgi:hypothetical protein
MTSPPCWVIPAPSRSSTTSGPPNG